MTGIIICIADAVSYFHNQSDEWVILDTYERYIDDPVYGTVYEVSFVVNEYPDIATMNEHIASDVMNYAQELQLDTDTVKISYYDESAIKNNGDPGCFSYLFLD